MLLTICFYSSEYLCFIGVVLDLELVSVRSAPGIVVQQPAPYRSDVVSVEVLEPHDPPLPILALPPPANTYRIPRIPLSAPAPIKKKVHRLSKKKAAVLADKQFKLERKQNRKEGGGYSFVACLTLTSHPSQDGAWG